MGYNIITPFLIIVFVPLFSTIFWCLQKRALLRKDLYYFSLGPEFDLAGKYASVLNTIFTTLTFCSGLPIILLFSSLALFVQYWLDKIMLLTWYRKPAVMGPAIHSSIIRTLPFCVLIHAMFAVWAYGSDDIFFCVLSFLSHL